MQPSPEHQFIVKHQLPPREAFQLYCVLPHLSRFMKVPTKDLMISALKHEEAANYLINLVKRLADQQVSNPNQ